MAHIGNAQGQVPGIHRRQGRAFPGSVAAGHDRAPGEPEGHKGEGPEGGRGAGDRRTEEVGDRHHRQAVLEQKKANQIELLNPTEPLRKQAREVVEKSLQAPFGPALALAPEGSQAEHRLLLHGRIPEQANRLALKQQAETEIQVVGDRRLVEAPTPEQGIPAQQLAVAPQFHDPTCRQPALLDHRIEGHLHGLGPGEPVDTGIDLGLAQLDGRPAACFSKGDQPLQGVALEIGIGIEHKHPAALQLLQHQVEGPRLATAGIGFPPQHLQKGIPLLKLGQQLGGAVAAGVVNHPKPKLPLRIAQLGDALHQPADHSLFIAGRHHHIHRRHRSRHRGGRQGRGRGGDVGAEGLQQQGAEAVATQHHGQDEGWDQPQGFGQPVGS